MGSVLGIVLALRTGTVLFWIGAAGVTVGAFYSFLKSRALGDLAVFLNFGILGSLGAWVIQRRHSPGFRSSGRFRWPCSLIGILHSNNWRDVVTDSDKKVFTMAYLLRDPGSLVYYGLLLFGSMGLNLFLYVPRVAALGLPALPPTFLIVLVALPRALVLWKRALKRHAPLQPMDFALLDGATAGYNLLFGLLCCTAALWLDVALKGIGVYR